jgi:hypothetical protein
VMAQEDHWLPGFNFNVEEWDAILHICRICPPPPRPQSPFLPKARESAADYLTDPRRVRVIVEWVRVFLYASTNLQSRGNHSPSATPP